MKLHHSSVTIRSRFDHSPFKAPYKSKAMPFSQLLDSTAKLLDRTAFGAFISQIPKFLKEVIAHKPAFFTRLKKAPT